MRYLWEKFKQKKDMRIHVLKLHGVNMSKAMFGNFDEELSGTQSFKCEICSLSYNKEKDLRAHKNLKHGSKSAVFPCQVCGKQLNQKNNMKKHEKTRQKKWFCNVICLMITWNCILKYMGCLNPISLKLKVDYPNTPLCFDWTTVYSQWCGELS